MPLPFPDLSNQEFGRLVVIGLKESGRNNPQNLWLCRCKCGNSSRFVIPGMYLLKREMWSCGCDTTLNYPTIANSRKLVIGGVVHESTAL